MNRLQEIATRLAEIRKELETELTAEQISEREAEIKALTEERTKLLNERKVNAKNAIDQGIETGVIANDNEERANKLVQTGKVTVRSTLLTSGPIAKPTTVDGIYNNQAANLGLLGEVKVKNRVGFEAVSIAFVKQGSSASAHTDGQAPTQSEPSFGVVKIVPASYALLSYVSKAIRRLSPLDYLKEVEDAAREALIDKAEDVIIAAATSSTDESTPAYDLVQNLTISDTAIGATTLRNIVLGFQPGRLLSGFGTLFLTNAQLLAFAAVRGTNEKKAVYTITPDASNQSGWIEENGIKVRYKIRNGLSNMLYGFLGGIELDTFGDTEVEVSQDYKFAEGLLAVRGEAYFGAKLYIDHGFAKISLTA
jgi:hypothetical protein